MTESVNIILCAFAFGLFILYLCRGKGSMKVLPFFLTLPTNSPPNPLKGAFHPYYGVVIRPKWRCKRGRMSFQVWPFQDVDRAKLER